MKLYHSTGSANSRRVRLAGDIDVERRDGE